MLNDVRINGGARTFFIDATQEQGISRLTVWRPESCGRGVRRGNPVAEEFPPAHDPLSFRATGCGIAGR